MVTASATYPDELLDFMELHDALNEVNRGSF